MSINQSGSATRGIVARLSLALALAAALPAAAAAQDKVYDAGELSVQPKVANMSRTAALVQQSYPSKLKSAGVDGTVQVEFVVGPDGKVEGSSIQVVAASVPALGDAAKEVAAKIEFKPGKVNDAPVRTRVLLPIVYKAR